MATAMRSRDVTQSFPDGSWTARRAPELICRAAKRSQIFRNVKHQPSRLKHSPDIVNAVLWEPIEHIQHSRSRKIRQASPENLESLTKMVQISEVKGNKRDNRTAAHTHIKGLGLKSDGYADQQSGGFVGQVTAREVCTDMPTVCNQ